MERLSLQESEQVLSGQRPAEGAAHAAGVAVDAIREALLVPASPEVAERHLVAMRAAAGSGAPSVYPLRSRPRRAAMLALAAALMLGVGIAGALTLPDRASDAAKERVADRQPSGWGSEDESQEPQLSDPSAHGQAVSGVAHGDSAKGCEHGRAVSDTASSKSADNRNNAGGHPGSCGPNEENNGNHGLGNNGNHGQGGNGNHGEGNNGNHGLTSSGEKGNNGQENNGNHAGQSAGSVSDATDLGGNGHSNDPHGQDDAPGQDKKETSDTDEPSVPLLPSGA